MIAAIYARKSPSDELNGTGDTSESVERQITHARAFAVAQGWTVAPTHIYVDDLISGGEFQKRPAFLRLMAAATESRRPPFDVLVMSDQDRLGRDMLRTATAIRDITEAGVRVFTYLDRTEITAASLMDQVKVMFAGFGGQFERERISLRTRDAANKRVREGKVGGGRVYGYDNVPTPEGKASRSVRVVNEAQAAVVRRIFQGVADGVGMKRIAMQLMAEGIPAPVRKNSRGWYAGTLRQMLHHQLYRGRVVWGRWEAVRRRGRKVARLRDPGQVLTVEAPELRIVSEKLWAAAHAALARKAEVFQRGPSGRLQGRPEGTLASAFLLTGIGACPCGGAIRSVQRNHRAGAPIFYGCSHNFSRGPRMCPNDLLIPMGDADRLVLEALAQDVLAPRLVERYLDATVAAWRSATVPPAQRRRTLEQELATVEREIANLEGQLATGAPWQLIHGPIEERKRRRDDLRARLEAEAHMAQLADGAGGVRADLAARLTDWQGLLKRQPIHARQILRKLLEGKLLFAPFADARGRGYEIHGRAVYGRLLAGIIPGGSSVGSGTGSASPLN
jgi:site-specific DNA recombinase